MVTKILLAFTFFSVVAAEEATARQEDYQFFQSISGKRRLTTKEETRKTALLNDASFLRTLKPVLNKTPTSPIEAKEQNAAIDFLREAVRSGDSDTAIEVLQSVVMDEPEDPELQGVRFVAEEKEGSLVPSPARDRAWINVTPNQKAVMRGPASAFGN